MNIKSQYKTKHREELIAYLETVPGSHVTVSDICAYFQAQGKPMGTATVYRQMEQMLNETVAKVLKTKNNYYVISEEDARKATDAKRTQWEEMTRNRRTR